MLPKPESFSLVSFSNQVVGFVHKIAHGKITVKIHNMVCSECCISSRVLSFLVIFSALFNSFIFSLFSSSPNILPSHISATQLLPSILFALYISLSSPFLCCAHVPLHPAVSITAEASLCSACPVGMFPG